MFAQIGLTSYHPHNFEYTESLDKLAFDLMVTNASGLISHAGMGTIAIAMDSGKPLLVMPRLKRYGEVVSDHQLVITKKFEKLGLLLAAYDTPGLYKNLSRLNSFVAKKRQNQTQAVIDRVSVFLNEIRCR